MRVRHAERASVRKTTLRPLTLAAMLRALTSLARLAGVFDDSPRLSKKPDLRSKARRHRLPVRGFPNSSRRLFDETPRVLNGFGEELLHLIGREPEVAVSDSAIWRGRSGLMKVVLERCDVSGCIAQTALRSRVREEHSLTPRKHASRRKEFMLRATSRW